MIVFKTFLKVLNKCKFVVIMYTAILVFFGGFNMTTSDTSTNFVASKPDIVIINHDEEIGITKSLINYIKENSNLKKIDNNKDAINDALFYREVNYVIEIPKNYRNDFLSGNNPKIEVKSTGDYQASLAEMLLSRYLKLTDIYNKKEINEEKIISNIEKTLSEQTKIEITSELDTNNLSKATFYYNFANYALLAGAIYVICLILSSFKNELIHKRTIISSMNYKEFNLKLLVSNGVFAVILWLFYIILSFILIGNVMLSIHGLLYIINSFVFTMCCLTLAFLIASLVKNKDAINGIVNVVSLGSSFLCGAFVPVQFLPDTILMIAHILPSYWYIQNNEMIAKLEEITLTTLTPYIINIVVVLIFTIIFIILSNHISKRKRKIA